ncbi:MAG: TIGR01212 family radical SAM protein [Clostridia bacterium]|nr:TIGR01212 family radical SAM protein [Clostridia bacterium]
MAQKDTNPYRYSDSNKRYMTYDWYLKQRFGGKVAKVTLDIGCTCPNLDGTRGHGGCIYCKSGSRSAVGETIEAQYAHGMEIACRKWRPVGFIPYFQSNTNTYGDIAELEKLYRCAAKFDGAVSVDVATRADCLSPAAVDALVSLAEEIPVTVELGLQTTDDASAARINRCHTYAEFVDGYSRLVRASENVNKALSTKDPATGLEFRRLTVGVHLINGLPGETAETMLKTARDVAELAPDMVKIHLMHVLTETPLAAMYESGEYIPMTREDYVKITCDQLELLPEDTVIGRVTGDGIAEDLLAPQWSRRKTEVANEIDKELFRRGTYQGCRYSEIG